MRKLANLPTWDAHYDDMVANQAAVTLTADGNDYTISGKLSDLVAFPSSVPAQGEHKWVGIDINTGLKSIVGATWDGSELTQDDEDEALALGLPKGHIVFWAKADALSTAREITIGKDEEEATFTIVFEDNSL